MIGLHPFSVIIYFIRISRLRFMKIYEYFKNKPKAEILKKTAKLYSQQLNRKNLSLTIIDTPKHS